MSVGYDFAALLVIIVGSFGAMFIVQHWTRAAADWLWLIAIRGCLVGSVSLVVLLATEALLRLVFGLNFMSSLGLTIGFIVTPLAATRIADWLAYLLARDRPAEAAPTNFIFTNARRRQSAEYSAPTVDP